MAADKRRVGPTIGLLLCAGLGACSGENVPSGPSTVASSPEGPPPLPPAASTAFVIDLPIAPADAATGAYGLWPFGVHGGGHALDGHPGWDLEYRPGASVLAAADGVVQNALTEAGATSRFTVRINHAVAGRVVFATDYTNLSALAPGIGAGAQVVRGQAVGPAGVQSQIIGTTFVTWAMTHFQVNDFSKNEGLTNPNAISPEGPLSASARSLFEAIWAAAAYQTEWCEPFATNSRLATFPLQRTWTWQSGATAPALEVRCLSESSREYSYSLRAADGVVLETGTFVADPVAKPLATVDFRPASGSSRLGVWDIVSRTLRLHLAPPGAARPASLEGGSSYTTS